MKRSDTKTRPLADKTVAALEPEEKAYRERDSKGLYLHVRPDGRKGWELRYRKPDGKYSWLGMGAYPDIKPKEARVKAQEARALDAVRDFIDQHGESRFSPIDAHESQPLTLIRDRAGWWRKVEGGRVYMFTPGGLKEATQGYDFRRALAALEEGKFFYRTGSNKHAIATRVLNETKKLYHVSPTIF